VLRSPELHPNPENATLDELRVAMDAAPNKRSYVRLNAIRSLLMGIERATLCKQFCRTDRMVRLWIELFNRGGIDALITKSRPGCAPLSKASSISPPKPPPSVLSGNNFRESL
jgi:hypothetical protein